MSINFMASRAITDMFKNSLHRKWNPAAHAEIKLTLIWAIPKNTNTFPLSCIVSHFHCA